MQVGNERTEIEIAAALAEPIDRPLNLAHSHLHSRHGVGHRQLPIIVTVDTQRLGNDTLKAGNRLGNIAGKTAAVGIAQNDAIGAAFFCRLEALQGVPGVRAVTVEKMFRVKNHFVHPLLHESDRVSNDL